MQKKDLGLITKNISNIVGAPSKRFNLICLAGVTLIIVVIILAELAITPEPVYEGKPLSTWLSELQPTNSEKRRAQARSAVQAIGTNALPFLLDRVSYRNNNLEKQIERLASMFRPRDIPRESEIRIDGISGFEALGPVASPAIPQLVRLLSEEFVTESALALGAIGVEALPFLAKALTNTNVQVRTAAAAGLRFLGADAEACTPALIELTNDNDYHARVSAIKALADTSRLPSLIPVFVGRLRDTNDLVRKESAEALGKLGKDAAPAISALEQTTRDSSEYVSKHALSALQRIKLAVASSERVSP